jgi:AcrR family transcriptional regulator
VYCAVLLRAADDREPPGRTSRRAGSRERPERSRPDQRTRLLNAVVEVVTETGFPDARVGDIAKRAGVSRATFYELFESKQASFLTAHRELSARMLERIEDAASESDPARAIDAAFTAVIDYAEREPSRFAFLTHEAMLAGPDALDQRDQLLTRITDQIEQAHRSVPSGAELSDAPPRMLLGGLLRVLGIRMRSDQYEPDKLLAELIGWVDYFRVPGGGTRQWDLAGRHLAATRRATPAGALPPAPLPRGRHRLPSELVQRIQRERIMHAAAEVIRIKGYGGASVTDIVAAAGVSREVFYSHFQSRADVYTATHQMIFEQLMAVTAGAFFATSGPWPERVWEAGGALTAFVASAPNFAHFGFVESYALGKAIARRTDDAMIAFTVFLREGHRYRPDAPELPAAAADATVVAAIDMVGFYVRHRKTEDLFALRPVTSYLILAPFMGADEARAFVERKLGESGSQG